MKYVIGIFTLIGLAIAAWVIFLYANIRFEVNKIVNYNPPLTTQFFDRNGDLIANIFQDEHRLYVKYDDIPPRIVEALIAIEDTQFFEHNGVNPDAISRAIIKDIKARKLVEGASTLTQQLVKNLLLTREKKITRKVKELLLSLRLETLLSKEEILERYLNQVYFGRGYYGIKTASLGYFKKELYELSLKEISILVGLPRAPSFYDPTKNLKFALARANQVVSRMNKLGWINKHEYEDSLKEVPEVFKQTRTQNKAPYVIDYATKELNKSISDLKTAGYKIKLTIDLKAQKIAREGLRKAHELILKRDINYFIKDKEKYINAKKRIVNLKRLTLKGSYIPPSPIDEEGNEIENYYDPLLLPKSLLYIKEVTLKEDELKEIETLSTEEKKEQDIYEVLSIDFDNLGEKSLVKLVSTHIQTLNGAMLTIENKSGKIITLVGGVDYKKSSFNRAIQSKRQPGSAVKPFLYQKALDAGYSPATNLIDISRTFDYKDGDEEKKWQPKNYEENYTGLITLREALIHSRNLATINLVTDLGIDVIYKGLKNYGFKDLPFDLSITLGSFSVSPLEMSKNFSMFSNKGTQVTPYIISSITNKHTQNIIFEQEENIVTTPEQAFLMTTILRDTVNRGTGRRARVKGLEIAGKTGTTNANVDAWFCGYSPSLQTIVWFGNDNNKPMGKRETGGRTAGPAFSYFYENYLKIHPEIPRKFEQPKEVRESIINGKKEYFTQTSKLPEIKPELQQDNDEIQF